MKHLRDAFFSLITISLGSIVIFLILSAPITPKIGLALRYDFSTIILFLFICVTLIFQIPGKYAKIILFGFTCAILALPINGLWSNGQSEQYVLGGILPFSDANFYYMDTRRLLEGGQFISGAARRPIFPAIFASIQWMTGQNLYISIAILTGIVAIALFFAVCEIRSVYGMFAGALFFVLIFLFVRFMLGKVLSEMAGLPLGLISFVFLYRSAKENKQWFFLIGLFFLSLALNARAGAFFILPMIALWGSITFNPLKKFSLKTFLFAIIAIVLGFAVNFLLYKVVSAADNMPFGNFSFTLYGLSQGGKGWTQIFVDHPEVYSMQIVEEFNYIYGLAFQSIITSPGLFMQGIISSYSTFFSLDDYYGSLCWFGTDSLIGTIARLGLYGLMAIGMVYSIRNNKNPINSLLLAAFLGIFFSIPFAPPLDSNRMRVYAATIPFYAAIPVAGFSFLTSLIPKKFNISREFTLQSIKMPLIIGLSLIVLMFIVLILIQPFANNLELPETDCPEGTTRLAFKMLPGNHVQIVEQGSISQDWLPSLQRNNFRHLVHDLPNYDLFPILTNVNSGQFILADLNLINMKEILLIADLDKIQPAESIQTLCAWSPAETNPELARFNVYLGD